MWIARNVSPMSRIPNFECWNCSATKPGIGGGVEWLETEDPILLAIPQCLLEFWEGMEGADYQRASACEECINMIDIGNGQGLVLAGDPASAGFNQADGRLSILRWFCANNVNDLVALAESQIPPKKTEAAVSLCIQVGGPRRRKDRQKHAYA
jgi:hypothetical protein